MEPTEHAVGVRVQLAAERFDQRTKRVLVAAAGGIHQGLEAQGSGAICEFFTHGRMTPRREHRIGDPSTTVIIAMWPLSAMNTDDVPRSSSSACPIVVRLAPPSVRR